MSLERFPSFLLNFSEGELSTKEQRSYSFRTFRLDVSERRLMENGVNLPLTPKAFDVLVHLVERSGHLVEKDELLEKIWTDSIVEEANLARVVHTLRRSLGEGKDAHKFIETVPKKGYRFVAEVTVLDEVDPQVGSVSRTHVSGVSDGPSRTRAWRPSAIELFPAFIALALILVVIVWTFRANEVQPLLSLGATKPETGSGEAYQQYSQGRFLVERRHEGDSEKALEHFENAIRLDPNYANALAGKADTKIVLFWGSSAHDDISQARTAVRRAIEIDPANSYARTVLCRILTTYGWDHAAAEKECRMAVELDPQNHEALKELAFLLSSLGKDEEALQAMEKAIAIAPTSFNKRSRGRLLYRSRRYDEAIEQLQQVGQTDPEYREAFRWLILCHQMKREYELALDWYLKLMEQSGASAEEIASVRSGFGASGWNSVLRHMSGNAAFGSMFRAATYAQLGEYDRAFEVLEEMYSRRSVHLITIAREPTLDPIRNDPRFADLLNRIGMKDN
ncbi:MAG: winged helix-turn-helix domain-containing protein [Pyrinomonadaceae bacterium]